MRKWEAFHAPSQPMSLTKVVTGEENFHWINLGHGDAQRVKIGMEMTTNL